MFKNESQITPEFLPCKSVDGLSIERADLTFVHHIKDENGLDLLIYFTNLKFYGRIIALETENGFVLIEDKKLKFGGEVLR